MDKTKSFVDKQEAKINHRKDYHQSLMFLFRKETAKKNQILLDEFAKDHNQEEIETYKKQLEAENESKLAKKQAKLDKNLVNYEKKIDNRLNANKKRIWEIDFIRGIIIIGMLIDHFFFDFLGLFTKSNFINLPQFYLELHSFANAYWVHPARVAIRLVGIFFLFLLSGISTHFSRNSLRRSFIVIGAGAIISIAFVVVSKMTGSTSDLVFMGAVMGIGVCMLLYSLFRMAFGRFKKIYKWLLLGISLAILIPWIFISRNVATNTSVFWFYYNGYAGSIEHAYLIDMWPTQIWEVLIGTRYFGSDWVGLFPNLGYFFLGAFISETVYKNRKSLLGKYNEKANKVTIPVVFAGRYSLWFYLLHQVVYIVVLALLALILGASLRI